MKNQKTYHRKRNATRQSSSSGATSRRLLDSFARIMASTVREAVLDWLDTHSAEMIDAFRRRGNFEVVSRPLPYHRFSLRLSRGLRSLNAATIGDVVTIGKDQLLTIKSLGTTGVGELENILREYGVPAGEWQYCPSP